MFKMNPWRKGVEAGYGYAQALIDYNARYMAGERGMNRPTQPRCPYPLSGSKNGGSYQWTMGLREGQRRRESEYRRELSERAAARRLARASTSN